MQKIEETNVRNRKRQDGMIRASARYARLAALLLLVSGCTSSGMSALHGVGAPRADRSPQPVQVTADTAPEAPAALGRTQKIATASGLSLNVAGAAQPQALAATNVPPQPEMGATREAAVSAIRTKAENSPDTPPNVFDVKRPPVGQMTAAEQAQFKAEMEAAAAANGPPATPSDARSDPLNWLKKKN